MSETEVAIDQTKEVMEALHMAAISGNVAAVKLWMEMHPNTADAPEAGVEGPAELLSQRAYAKRRGVSNVAVHKAIKDGRISTVPGTSGKINPALADLEWEANTRPSAKPGEAGDATPYSRARTDREAYQAELAKLRLDQERGTLVRADEVQEAAMSAVLKARSLLEGIPDRVSATLASITGVPQNEVREILEAEYRSVCEELSGAQRG